MDSDTLARMRAYNEQRFMAESQKHADSIAALMVIIIGAAFLIVAILCCFFR